MSNFTSIGDSATWWFPINVYDYGTRQQEPGKVHVTIIEHLDGKIKRINIHGSKSLPSSLIKGFEDAVNSRIGLGSTTEIERIIKRYSRVTEVDNVIFLPALFHELNQRYGINKQTVRSVPDGVAYILKLYLKRRENGNK